MVISTYEIHDGQVLKLLELLEVKMISDVQRKIQKEVTLALAERARDETSALPTDLWKRVVGAFFTPEIDTF